MLQEARSRTLALMRDLTGEQLMGPRLAIVNPPLWEIGHLGWFQEYWCLRYRGDLPADASQLAGADALYDSAAVPHATRWSLPLPDIDTTFQYLQAVLEAVLGRVARASDTDPVRYFTQLAAFHEQMHCEAFTYARQTLSYSAPGIDPVLPQADAGPYPGDAEIAGRNFTLGALPGSKGFVFDNEKWAHAVRVPAFAIARAAVTNSEFAAFVEDAGYRRRELWSEEGWQWRESARADSPVYWRKVEGKWMMRRYDAWAPLRPHAAIVHVNWFEADAWCRWAGRRLPTEAEWEMAAATAPAAPDEKRTYPWGDAPYDPGHANLYGAAGRCVDVAAYPAGDSAWGCRQMFGNVWEWTADWFRPYPGYLRDPYKEYSEPWFGDHKVLRGGCFATAPGLLRNTWRNFYTPDRRDVFAGFRTCATNL